MLLKSGPYRFFILFLLVLLFPLVQNQWLNLYLFDINNFTFYKLLYYLSGLICPILVCLKSLSSYTYYNYSNDIRKYDYVFSGKLLFILITSCLFLLSNFISNYIYINIGLLFNLFMYEHTAIIDFDIKKYIFILLLFSILLIFKKSKIHIKKLILVNYFIFSILIWYSKINNLLLYDSVLFTNILKLEYINYFNILFLLFIEILYYSWSYISYSTHLSDWILPIPKKIFFLPIFDIIFFYLLVIVYYSALSN